MYLAAVIDVASRRMLAHKLANTQEAHHVVEIMEQAYARYGMPDIVNTARIKRPHSSLDDHSPIFADLQKSV